MPGLDAFDFLEGDNLLAVALTALMRCPRERKAELKAGALRRVATAPVNAARRYLLAECIQAYLSLEEPQLQEYEHLLRTEPYQEARTLNKTMIELGRIEVLRRQLQSKFGPLTQTHLERLNEMTPEQLDALAIALLAAKTLAELGLEG